MAAEYTEMASLSIINEAPKRLVGPNLLHELIQGPSDVIALEHADGKIITKTSYSDLHSQSFKLSSALLKFCHGQEQRIIPVLLPQCSELYIGLLAVLKAGAAFCPLNLDAPEERIKFILKDVAANVIITRTEFQHIIPRDAGVEIILIEGFEDASSEATLPRRHIEGTDLAYVMYTSGSTGTPKGVALSHDAVTQALLAHDRHMPSFSRFLQFAAPTFDVSVFEIFFPLYRGSTLISAKRSELLDDLPSILSNLHVDACELTPTVAANLLKERRKASSLNLLLTIGEMLNSKVVEEFGGSETQQSMLWAMYGPTEATIHCTLQPSMPSSSSSSNIGKPLDTTSCFIIDPSEDERNPNTFKVLPRGSAGELAIGGHQLANGYLNNPVKTQAAFIDTPYGRLYRTGDRARITDDGQLECLGRLADGQVKLRGQRIELGEVEATLFKCKGCFAAAAAVIDALLVVFCCTDTNITEDTLLSTCQSWLPKSMIPGDFVIVPELPRLPSGKVDKKALIEQYRQILRQRHRDSQHQTSPTVLTLLSEVLNIGVVEKMTLSAAGVDSLRAITVASSLRDAGFNASGADILKARTFGDLCRHIEKKKEKESLPPLSTVRLSTPWVAKQMQLWGQNLESVDKVMQCTTLQASMISETIKNPSRYWNTIELEVDLKYAAEQVTDALRRVCQANESLRLQFAEDTGVFYSIIRNSPDHILISNSTTLPNTTQARERSALSHPVSFAISRGRILIEMHHAVYDGWSSDLLISDLSDLLSARSPPPRPQFSEIVRQLQGGILDEQVKSAKAFWAEYLHNWSKPPLPKLLQQRNVGNYIETQQIDMAIDVSHLIGQGKVLGISPQTFFQAALFIAWSGIIGSNDVVIGSVTSGRTMPIDHIEGIMGPCIVSLPLRADLSHMNTHADILKSIYLYTKRISQHDCLSLADIRRMAVENGSQPLYDLLFVYQESTQTRNGNKGVVRETHHLDNSETKLIIEAEPRGPTFNLQATYHLDCFPSEFITTFMTQIHQILTQIINDLYQNTQVTRRSLTRELSTNNVQPKKSATASDIAALFKDVALRHPDSPAIHFFQTFDGSSTSFTSITYRQLDELGNQIANLILSRGVQPGQIISIMMEKSILLYATILGIMKAKCAYLPLLPTTPVERVRTIFQQAQPSMCIVDNEKTIDSQWQLPLPSLDVLSEDLSRSPKIAPTLSVDDDYLAYIIYTSGTTGVPKGVAVTQKNIVSNVTYLESLYPQSRSGNGRLLQACSQAFDVSVFEIFYTWHAGMCLCSAANDDLFADLEHSIREARITHLSLTPTVASLIDPVNVPNVEFLVTAGEPMTQAVLDKWGTLLWQGYGPSETTNICSVKRMDASQHIEHLGWVFPNTSVVVLFPDSLAVVPIGWVGEYCFGGDQVAAEYLHMEQMTKDKFITHPEYGRLYRSGDMGRMLPDGSLMIIGRLDSQLKLRGQRIEAAEINSIVTSHAFIDSADTLLARRKSNAAQELVTFYTKDTSSDFEPVSVDPKTQGIIFASLSSRLPSYMIPSYLINVSAIPRTSSGKVDRRQLQATFASMSQSSLEQASNSLQHEGTADWTSTEKRLAAALSQIMDSDDASIKQWTPFVTLGIDSISAISISKRLREITKFVVPVSALLQHPTVSQLAMYLDSTPTQTPEYPSMEYFSSSTISSIRAVFDDSESRIEAILPCSPLQQGMLARGKEKYYNSALLRLHVDVERIKQAWDQVIRRNEILRTCFVTTRESQHPIAQVILAPRPIVWKQYDVDVPSLDVVVGEHQQELGEPLDSGHPPLSFALIKYKESHFLSLICHHALYDGVAMDLLWREVEAAVNAVTLPPPVRYAPFIHQATALPADTLHFWRAQFESFCPSILFPRQDRGVIGQSFCSLSLDIGFKDIQAQARSLGVTLLSLCQATWAQVLSCALRTSDVCFGNVMSGRTIALEDIDRLIAPCFNTIPIRKNIAEIAQNLELVKHFHQQNNDLLPYQFTPLRDIQKVVGARKRSLFDTLLLVQQPLEDMDNSVWTLETDSGAMDVPLVCEVIPCPNLNSVLVTMHYDMTIVTSNVASTFRGLFQSTFNYILQAPFSNLLSKQELPSSVNTVLDTLKPRVDTTDATDDIAADDASQYVPSTPEEELVISVVSELAGVPKHNIKPTTTIFHLGLDSINAVQVASMIRERGYQLSASDVVDCRSCQRIATRMCDQKSSVETDKGRMYDFGSFAEEIKSQVTSIADANELAADLLPCTPMQTAMLNSFEQSMGRNYLNGISYLARNGLTGTCLFQAWETLVTQRTILRTGFHKVQHHDTAYAMIQWSEVPNDMISLRSHMIESEIDQWKSAMSNEISTKLYLPAWKVLLNETSAGTEMHLLVHHALYDAESLRSLLQDLDVLCQGDQLLPSPGIESGLSRLMMDSLRESEAAKSFWESQCNSIVVNQFPTMTPLREQSREILTGELQLSQSSQSLQNLASELGVTMQAAIQAAWTRVLSSYLGETHVSFGVTLSSRTAEDTQGCPLPCLITVPVIGIIHDTNIELLKYMMDFNVEMYDHQNAPLSKIQRWLGHPANAVFDTLLAYQKPVSGTSMDEPWTVENDDTVPEYPVSLEVEPVGEALLLRLTYFSDILPPQQGTLLLKQFEATLVHLLQHPEAHGNSLSASHEDLFSVTPAHVPIMESPVRLLHEFVEISAKTYASRIGLEFVHSLGGSNRHSIQQWTFKELNDQGNRVANLLMKHVKVGDIVAIHFDKCPEAYFAILGILKSGCSFVALDPSAPESRKQFILQDSQAPCLLTSAGEALGFSTPCSVLKVSEELLAPYSASFPKSADLTPDNTCYCLYTSGTTGTPKGCEITHDNAVQAMMAFTDLFKGHWDSESKWLQFASLHFDVSVLEQYWSWSVGMTVVGAKKDLILSDLTGFINILDITHIDLTPSLARLTHPDDVPSLCRGVFITGGESLKQEILDAWGPAAVIYNAYGPTEATIGVTMYQRVPQNGRPSNIGKQFLNVGSYVVQQGTEIPVLRGGVGELCVQGKLVGKGYLHRPELTEERFPTFSRWDERVYRTGDLVRILHDGCFDFLGRADDQVKLRGQRLEIGEINHCIRTGVSSIKDVATLVLKHTTSGKDMLVSFVADDADHDGVLKVIPDDSNLLSQARMICQDKLPTYMVPSYFLRLSFIPLSANNKLEAKEITALFMNLTHEDLLAASSTESKTSAVHHATEIKLCSALSSFCKVKMSLIGPSMNIFDLGIDSITVIQFSSSLRNTGFTEASPGLILRHPVIRDLAIVLTGEMKSAELDNVKKAKQLLSVCHHKNVSSVCEILQVIPDMIDYIAPCSALQQGMVSRALTDEENTPYFNRFSLNLNETASVVKLRESWTSLIESDGILRTSFVNTPGGLVQVALKHNKVPWNDVTLQDGETFADVASKAYFQWVEKNRHHVLCPLEFLLLSNLDGQRDLVIFVFHALYDGISFDVMLRDVAALYIGETPSTRPVFLDALVHGSLWNHDAMIVAWREHLAQWRPDAVTCSKETQSVEYVSTTRILDLPELQLLCSTHKMTLQTALLAAWANVLRRLMPNAVTIGTVVSGRAMNLDNVEGSLGPLFNTLPVFVHPSAHSSSDTLCQAAHQFHQLSLMDQHVPLKDIQRQCSGGRPLFDNLFTLQLEEIAATISGPWTMQNLPSSHDYPLALEVTKLVDGRFKVHIVAAQNLNNKATSDSLIDDLERSVAELNAGWSVDTEIKRIPVQDDLGNQETEDEIDRQHFDWDVKSLAIRQELSRLAGVSASEILHSTPMTALGLDSVDVIQLASLLKRRGLVIAPSKLMKLQTIQRLMSDLSVDSAKQTPATNSRYSQLKTQLLELFKAQNKTVTGLDDVLPATALQESMIAAMLKSDFMWYFNHEVFELNSNIDVAKLEASWNHLAKSTSILRTGFAAIADPSTTSSFCQVVLRHCIHAWQVLTLNADDGLDTVMKDARNQALGGQLMTNLLQIRIVTRGEQRLMIVSMAHALYDGWSLSLLYQRLWQAYNDIELIPSNPDKYLSHYFESMDDSRSFWTSYLSGTQRCILSSQSSSTRRAHFEGTSSHSLTSLKEFCKEHHITLQSLLQACWALVLASRTGSLDVVFGTVLSGRDYESSETLVFPTMNTVAFRCILHSIPTNFLSYIEDMMSDVRQHQSYPLRQAQAAAGFSGQELFNSLFILQRNPGGSATTDEFIKSIDGNAATDYPLCIEAEALSDSLIWRIASSFTEDENLNPEAIFTDLNSVFRYLLQNKDIDLLKFDNDKVSICGLPSVSTIGADASETSSHAINGNKEWNDTSICIRDVLSRVSGVAVDTITPSTTLFHLGLDSISAIKVAALLREQGMHIGLRQLMQGDNIHIMAQHYNGNQSQAVDHDEPSVSHDTSWTAPDDMDLAHLLVSNDIDPDTVEAVLPATPLQVYMMTVWHARKGAVFMPEFTYSLDDAYSPEDVSNAWDQVVQSTPILRAQFITTGDSDTPMLQITRKAEKRMQLPLVKLSVDKREDDGEQLTVRLRIHHALYDAFSLPAIIQRLSMALQSQPIPSHSLQSWSQHVKSVRDPSQDARDFWSKYLADHDSYPVQESSESENGNAQVSEYRPTAMKDDTTIKTIASSNGVTIQALFFAAYAMVLASRRNNQRVVFGIYLANRAASLRNQLPVSYPTLNLVPLRAQVLADTTITSLAIQIQADLIEIGKQDRPNTALWQIAQWTGVKVTSFVNFLSTVDSDESQGILAPRHTEASNSMQVDDSLGFIHHHRMEINTVANAYPMAIDIEVAVRDGGLDLGVFGPASCISNESANDLMDDIVAQLEHCN